MDQDAYRSTYRNMNERCCLFEKSILAGQCNCALAERFYLAEREGMHCGSDQAQSRCEEWLKLVRQHARFALRSQDETSILPHAKAMRLQVGGLRGLFLATHAEPAPPVTIDNIHELLDEAIRTFQVLHKVPFQEVIKQIASYQGRKRRKKR